MIRRPPRSTLFPYTDALPISQRTAFGPRLLFSTSAPYVAVAARSSVDVRSAVNSASEMSNSVVSIVRHLTDRKSTRLNSSHLVISYAVFCLKKKKKRLSITYYHTCGRYALSLASDVYAQYTSA